MAAQSGLRRKFISSIRRGTGEAQLIMESYTSMDFSDEIIDACLKNYAYDGQCESSRAEYLNELICLSEHKDRIRQTVLNALAVEKDDTWTLTQLFDLAKIFALDNYPGARQAIYDRYLENIIDGSDWAGYDDILELDGLDGLKFIADKTGRYIEKNPDYWEDDSVISHFQDDHPETDACRELALSAETNPYIAVYLENIRQTIDYRNSHRREPEVYTDLIDEILTPNRSHFFYRREFTDEELISVANWLVVEKDEKNIEKFLRVFYRHKFPLDSEFILSLARQEPSTAGSRVQDYAQYALKHLKSRNIRKYALDGITSGQCPDVFVAMLKSNYESGDAAMLARLVNRRRSVHIIHDLSLKILDIYDNNPTPECLEPLLALYKRTRCAECRQDIVRLLKINGVLPDRINREIKFDSNLETRKLYLIKNYTPGSPRQNP